MKIFVTGATGYLGYHFVKAALRAGHEVLCLRRETSKSLFEPSLEEKVQWVINNDTMKEIVKSFKPDVLFHAAWGGVRGNDRDNVDVQNENIVMSRNLFLLYPYKQIISIGSQAEYGYYSDVISEDYSLNPTMEYAKSKVKCCNEMIEICQNNNIEWQWIRIFTVFGEKQTGGLIKLVIEKCLNNEQEFDTTKGEQKYSYLYAPDFGRAICSILGSKGKSGVYNLSQPQCLKSNREIIESVKKLTKSTININFGTVAYPEGQVMLMDGKVDKFESTFEKIPYTNFNTALNNTINDAILLRYNNLGGVE